GNVYLAGETGSASGIASGGFQNTPGGGEDALLVKFDASGNRLWATYYGGSGNDRGYGVASDVSGNVYLAGRTGSAAGIASGGFQNIFAGGVYDAFLVKFDAVGKRLCATYYGGQYVDYGNSVATDASGYVYLAGETESAAGIATAGAFQDAYGPTKSTGFLVKFSSCFSALSVTAVSTDACLGQCIGTTTATPANGTAPYTYSWNTTPPQATKVATGLCIGTYSVTVTDAASNSATVAVAIAPSTLPPCCVISATVSSDPSSTVCVGQNVFISASGGTTYSWHTGATGANIVAAPSATTTYSVMVTDAAGCTGIGTLTVPVDPNCSATGIDQFNNAEVLQVAVWPNPSNGMFNVQWLMADGNTPCIEIYNVFGEKVYSAEVTPINHEPLTINLSFQPSGIYFLRVSPKSNATVSSGQVKTERETLNAKIVIQK
ncbi:MAG: T9SS type A sorting domain-containing protein, partial [Bacteroidetes bacterium]